MSDIAPKLRNMLIEFGQIKNEMQSIYIEVVRRGLKINEEENAENKNG